MTMVEYNGVTNDCYGLYYNSTFALITGGSAAVNIGDVKVTGCDTPSQSCIFRKGTMASITLPFTPGKDTIFNNDIYP